MAQLICRNLSVGYDGRAIVTGIDFSLDKGDYLCIVGENGSGKTTFMKTLLGLQPPVSGEMIFGEGAGSDEIGYLPQQTEVQKDFPASVGEIVLSGCQNRLEKRFFYSREDKQRAYDNMKKMRIADLSKKCYRELSGGQQQRVLLARALCAAKTLLLLDEPVSGLDPRAADEMYSVIESLNSEDKLTIIMISHDIAAALNYASHILHIGDKVFFGEKAEYLKNGAGKAVPVKEGETKNE